ncbi:MAG: hypothetical protein ACK5LC_16985 [Coprobacillaceae bacterium]
MSALSFSCPHCGAPIENLKEGDSYHCPYCDSHFSFAEVQAATKQKHEENLEETKIQHEKEIESEKYEDQVVTYECKQCGAQVVSDKNTVATFCLYCHSPNVIPARLIETYQPDKIIPFMVNEEKAKAEFQNWTKNISFLPDSFSDSKHLEKISPLYTPYWLYSMDGDFDLKGTGIRKSSWRSGNYRYTKTDYYDVTKTGVIKYSRIPADASLALENKTMQLLEPYDYKAMVDFDMAHLIGHYAEKYDDSKDALSKEVEGEVNSDMSSQISGMKSSFHSFRETTNGTQLKNQNTEYAFMPVWFLNYKYENKDYAFTMNGQSRKVVGFLPIDKNKQKSYLIKTAGIVFVIALLINVLVVANI